MWIIRKRLYVAVVAVCLIVAVGPVAGQTWNASTDFSVAGNPNGVWSYGYAPNLAAGYQLVHYAGHGIGAQLPAGWQNVQYWWASYATPAVYNNPASTNAVSEWGTIPAQSMAMHPGMNNERSVVRWTAPAEGLCAIRGSFKALNFGKVDGTVLQNGLVLWTRNMDAGQSSSFILDVLAAANDTVDFAGGYGADNTFSGDLTGLSATVELVPGSSTGTITGTVTANLPGHPAVVGAKVQVVGTALWALSGTDGSYTLTVRAGTYTVEIIYSNILPQQATVNVPVGGTITQHFDLTFIGTVKGRVTANVPGRPILVGATVRTLEGSNSTTTGTEGGYSLVLPVGTPMIQASYPNTTPAQAVVTITAGGQTIQDLELTPYPGVTYYVSPTGDDSSDGTTSAVAWRTISNGDARRLLLPGDTVVVAAGTYPQSDALGVQLANCSGNAASPITYKAVGKVVIDQTSIPKPDRKSYGFLVTVSGVVIDGFEVIGCQWGVCLGDNTQNNTVSRCVVHDLTPGDPSASDWYGWCGGVYVSNSSNDLIHHNVIYNVGVQGSSKTSGCVMTTGSSQNTRIYNNTMVGSWSGVYAWSNLGVAGAQVIRNNIIEGMWDRGIDHGSSTGCVNSHNLYYNNSTNWGPNTYWGTGEFEMEPRFVNSMAHDYHLQASSPAVNAGTDVGFPYYGSAPDIGAFELAPKFTTDRIGSLRAHARGTEISITSPKVVTAASITFNDHSYYIEEPDRAAGIKVIPDNGVRSVTLGDRITFDGVMTTDPSGERAVRVTSTTTWSAGDEVRPLGVSGKAITATEGLDVSGLLVRLCGWITYASGDGSYIYVDDGSSLQDGSGKRGVRVVLDGLVIPATIVPGQDQYVAVTGLAGFVKDETIAVRAVRPRGDGDVMPIHATLDEMSRRHRWILDNLGADSTRRPFSFIYGGQSSDGLLGGWQQSFSTRTIDDYRTERTITYDDPITQMQVRCVAVEYNDFPTVEWTIYFKNNGSANTPILENIQALNMSIGRSPNDEFLLHHNIGSPCTANDYQPLETILGSNATKRITAEGGRPTNSDLSYFNLETSPSSGVIIVVGWPGQWAAQFTRDAGSGLSVVVGQETTHFRLYPGEEVRTPLMVLQFWNGDWIRSQNIWRRWMIAHNVPRPGGQPLAPLIFGTDCYLNGNELILMNEAQENLFIDRYVEEDLHPDCWWMDAGWYVNHGSWMNTGTWEVDTERFPDGLRGVTDHARSHGMKTMVWFEPERATYPSWLNDNHPDWLLGTVGLWQLVYLGNPAAWQWAVNLIDTTFNQEGIDWYRQDFNWDPLPLWQGNDAADRQGITEIKHVTGYLAFWDELLRRHPDMLIDSCASGGRRNDLETLRRAVPLWRSDYAYSPPAMQCQTYGISMWMPYYGTGVGHPYVSTCDPYTFRSETAPSVLWAWDMRRPDLDYDLMRSWMATWRELAPNCLGDYYPLTSYSTASNVWMAWQFDRPEVGEGMVQAFRRPDNTQLTVVFKLRGLDPAAQYTVSDIDSGLLGTVTGSVLTDQGVAITITSQPGAAVVTYKKLD
ncbi:MAG: alpha-galactosidase [Armatimonadetes bacterium]|nr:alpha-galactosidase [Armatimonadota bacterium]